MDNKSIIEELEQSKEFVRLNAKHTTPEIAEEIQSELSTAIEAARNDDMAKVCEVISRIGEIVKKASLPWDLAPKTREYCKSI